jgi:hypothetical protein
VTEEAAFARAYVALGYLFGVRGVELVRGIAESKAASALMAELDHPDQAERARALARELALVAKAVLRRRLT